MTSRFYRNLNKTRTHGVFDLSTNFTNFALADVNLSQKKIDELHYYAKTKIYNADIVDHFTDQKIPYIILKKYADCINKYKENAILGLDDNKEISFYGIIRYSLNENIQTLLDFIYCETEVSIKSINKHQEGIIAYNSTLTSLGKNFHDIIIWNIDEYAIQFIVKKNESYVVASYNSTYKEFYNLVKKEIKKQESIYPITKYNIKLITELALNLIKSNPDFADEIKKHIKNGYKVIGKGGMHNKNAQYYVNLTKIYKNHDFTKPNCYNIGELKEAIAFLSKKTFGNIIPLIDDKEKHNLLDQEIISLILIATFMQELDIKLVHTKNFQNIFGLLVYENH